MENDFSQGKVWKNIMAQAIPLTLAQIVQLLYNIVDRIYIGHLEDCGSMALTGIGLTFPIVTLIAAFTNLFGTGGTPLFSIERGKKNEDKAEKIMGNVFSMLLMTSVVLMVVGYIFKRPILFLFGASDSSYVYANAYLKIYLIGTVFSMVSAGMNGFINAQGFPKISMLTTLIGAILNLILDPVFIFLLGMGVEGAAFATIISQAVSAFWVFRFLTGRNAILSLKMSNMKLDKVLVKNITSLGLAGFMVQGTNAAVQIACNSTLHTYGGDMYVGIMTVINSVRDVLSLPIHGLTSGSQPVIGYNYGAKKYDRVRQGIRFSAVVGIIYTLCAWLLVLAIPRQMISLFSRDTEMLDEGVRALKIYFFGFFFMAFQFAGQSTFQALGKAKKAIFFSLFRKAIIVVPLTLILPQIGMGITGVYVAEPVSNAIGGLACFTTMYMTVYRKLK